MSDPIAAAGATAFSGLYAQSLRMKVIAENIANAESTGRTPGADPYRRKMVSFSEVFDQTKDAATITADVSGVDQTPFRTEHMPGSPAADKDGNVKMPNVNMTVEMTDMKQALRSYEANLQVIKQGREMAASLVDLLKG
ncbi:flagellar basal body rod protein FlgC [Aestuariivirga litoralis]|uniref:flagellar basal body rod protein FlgC n=1 Tax=Aestuariivirga litoralis TaxID=2650924 RepID=UPI0018C8193B|nr:flagellar basal body rod protein FlgC [Aestuariivirga litoralis]MBG1233198.1 flagellar basal body rod protein FlgC [Aestuariivirga litoralis]